MDVPEPGTQKFNQTLNPPASGTQKFDAFDPPPAGAARTPIIHNDGNAITKPVSTRPSVGAPREGNLIEPNAPGTLLPRIQGNIPRERLDPGLLHNNSPLRPMDTDFAKRHPVYAEEPQLAKQRVENWIDNPHLAANLDAKTREALFVAAHAGSVRARQVLEQNPNVAYQPDMSTNYGGVFENKANVVLMNPYRAHPTKPLNTVHPVEAAAVMLHEVRHGQGKTGQLAGRGGQHGTPTDETLLGQGQGRGYNEFAAFMEEGDMFLRIRQARPDLFEGVSPETKKFSDGFNKALDQGPKALRDFLAEEMRIRGYAETYPTPLKYAAATTPYRAGGNLRIVEGRKAGMSPEAIVGGGTHADQVKAGLEKLKKAFPGYQGEAPLPTALTPPPVAPAGASAAGSSSKKPTIQYPQQTSKSSQP
jgi:hypothetical protein